MTIRRLITLWLLTAILLGGLALRLYRINAMPLRGDEAFTVLHWMREPLANTLTVIAPVDPQPPLAYLFYRGWSLTVGSHELAVRFLPALVNTIGIAAIFALGLRLGGRKLGLLAALVWAFHPLQVWHGQDARNYAIWSAASLVALWLSLRALELDKRVDWLLYVAAASAASYIYYLELFVIAALNIYVIAFYRKKRAILVRWFVAQVLVALILSPWYLQERLLLGSGYTGTASGFDPALWLMWFLPSLAFGDTMPGHLIEVFWWVLLVWLVLAAVVWWNVNRRYGVLLVLIASLPLLLLAIISVRLNVFVPRYVLASAPAYALLILGSSLLLLKRPSLSFFLRSFAVVSLVVYVVFLGFGLLNHYFSNDYAKTPDWRALVGHLREQVHVNDLIINTAADEAFTFYLQEYEIDAQYLRLPANPAQTVQEIETILGEYAPAAENLWLAAQPPSDWANADAPYRWAETHMLPLRRDRVGGLWAFHYVPQTVQRALREPAAWPAIQFENVAALDHVEVFRSTVAPERLDVLLSWQALAQTETPLKVFVHLVSVTDAGLQTIWSQDDAFPQDGRIATTNWQPGVVYNDTYTLASPTLAGDFALIVGWYEPVTGRRLRVGSGDYVEIARVSFP